MRHAWHLVKRFAASLPLRAPTSADTVWAQSFLLDGERELWQRLSATDQRHSIVVARRFERLDISSGRDEMAAALLHDIGKLDSGLGTLGRVAATIIGPRTERFRRYHDHEGLGAALLRSAGSSPTTVDLVLGLGNAAEALRAADDI